jgi:hypothetical protein
MSYINDGGSPFTVPKQLYGNGNVWQYAQPGMSLRDYFAAHTSLSEVEALAPATVKGCAALLGINECSYNGNVHYVDVIAKIRYQIADAMIKERSK